MYSGEDGEAYVELGYLGKVIPTEALAQPDKSKAGGLPAWFGEAPVDVNDLVCRLCGRELFLVVQIYAPTHMERSLCVFGCNRATCCIDSQGWRVIRTQKQRENRSITNSTIRTTVATAKPADDVWGEGSESWGVPAGEDWGAETGDWESKDEVTAAVIDALLEEREMGSVEKPADRTKRTTAPGTAVDKNRSHVLNSGLIRRCFPAKPMEFSPEPWGTKGGDDDKDMETRIQRYRETEDDRGLIVELDRALGLETSDGSKRSGRAEAAGGEKYERTPKRAKAIIRFAERVSRAPQQVLRYAYEGEPIWSAADPPRQVVPPCPCGAARVFEMQLMPALLLHLRVNDFAEQETYGENKSDPDCNATKISSDTGRDKASLGLNCQERGRYERRSDIAGDGSNEASDSDSRPVLIDEERERLRTWGMDWGVVAIWSCPTSCEVSCEEFAVVQLPV